jgi:hypothetical protein
VKHDVSPKCRTFYPDRAFYTIYTELAGYSAGVDQASADSISGNRATIGIVKVICT